MPEVLSGWGYLRFGKGGEEGWWEGCVNGQRGNG